MGYRMADALSRIKDTLLANYNVKITSDILAQEFKIQVPNKDADHFQLAQVESFANNTAKVFKCEVILVAQNETKITNEYGSMTGIEYTFGIFEEPEKITWNK